MGHKIILILLLMGCTSHCSLASALASERKIQRKVFISQVVEHPAIAMTTQGIIDALAQAGFKQNESLTLRIESAQGNASLAAQIASKFIHQQPDVVVGVGTLAAQSLVQASTIKKIPLVFSSVTDPGAAGLVQQLHTPAHYCSGVSNQIDLAPQIALFQRLQPQLKRLGILYNPGESNAVSIVNRLKTLAPQQGVLLIAQSATRGSEVAQAAVKLAASVDAIFISNDNLVLSSLPSVIKAANRAKIPVYVSDTDAVAQGAVAALGPNQYAIGWQTGQMIIKILQGADIATLPIEQPVSSELYINLAAAYAVGLTVSESIRSSATRLIEHLQP